MGGNTKLETRQRPIDMRASGPTRVCPNAKNAESQRRKQTNAHDDANATWANGARQDYSQKKFKIKINKKQKASHENTRNTPKRPQTRKPKNVSIAISRLTFLGGTQDHTLRVIPLQFTATLQIIFSSREYFLFSMWNISALSYCPSSFIWR